MDKIFPYDSVELSEDGKELIILDQSVLPNAEVFLRLTSAGEIFFAITLLKVRGAPAIGIAAALGLAMCMNRMETDDVQEFEDEFLRIKRHLYISRPTAVNLMWALDRMERCYYETRAKLSENDDAIAVLRAALTQEARSIKDEDIRMCLAISENGFSLMKPKMGVLTHCNAGHLAVSRYGTALGPVYFANRRGYAPAVFCCETRPMMQGSRLTAFELMKAGVDTTLICDDMASIVMSQKKIDAVFVGCDRIAANGDVANKVGTSALAILARHYGIPFYVLGPTSTFDLNCASGSDIEIEERPSYEVTDTYFSSQMAPKGVKVYNPAFDITPADLITGIVTEKGIFKAADMSKTFGLK